MGADKATIWLQHILIWVSSCSILFTHPRKWSRMISWVAAWLNVVTLYSLCSDLHMFKTHRYRYMDLHTPVKSLDVSFPPCSFVSSRSSRFTTPNRPILAYVDTPQATMICFLVRAQWLIAIFFFFRLHPLYGLTISCSMSSHQEYHGILDTCKTKSQKLITTTLIQLTLDKDNECNTIISFSRCCARIVPSGISCKAVYSDWRS